MIYLGILVAWLAYQSIGANSRVAQIATVGFWSVSPTKSFAAADADRPMSSAKGSASGP